MKLFITLLLCLGVPVCTEGLNSGFRRSQPERPLNEIKPSAQLCNTDFNYCGLGLCFPLCPSFVIGHRKKCDKSGIDLSARFTTFCFACNGLSARACALCYWGHYYGGAGVAFGVGIPQCVYVTPSLTFGKENETNFHQIHLGILNHSLNERGSGMPAFPVICYDYGIKF